MKIQSSPKNTAIEFWRFICALIIMVYHSYEFGIPDYPFSYNGWLFVEFFFILSGYFVTNHVRTQQNRQAADYPPVGIYVFRRIKKIYPYVLVSVIWIYVFYFLSTPPTSKRELVNIFENFILEISFLGSVTNIMALNGPIWYLSTMFLAMPFFILLVRKRNLSASVSLVAPVLFYTNTGMILGSKITAICRLGCFFLPIFLSFHNAYNNWLLLFLFILAIALCIQSNPQYPAAISNIFSFLGETSGVLFLMQYPIIRTVQFIFKETTKEQQCLLYYILSLIVSMLIVFLSKKINAAWVEIKKRYAQKKNLESIAI